MSERTGLRAIVAGGASAAARPAVRVRCEEGKNNGPFGPKIFFPPNGPRRLLRGALVRHRGETDRRGRAFRIA
jgi:hypothetical protein